MARVIVPISLPRDLNLRIKKQVKKRGFASKSEYFRDLARENLDRVELEEERKKHPRFYAKLDRELKKGLKAIDRGEYAGPFTAEKAVKFLASIGSSKIKK
ncbi:MAG: hypothetical protein HY452_02405 [Parcubacteria group bacterium]|nr:hypothetical protein [Candidatus Sungbacteria bacterium]MBI4119091.1 hypothetical protein [Parcubacteria group bacterium]